MDNFTEPSYFMQYTINTLSLIWLKNMFNILTKPIYTNVRNKKHQSGSMYSNHHEPTAKRRDGGCLYLF